MQYFIAFVVIGLVLECFGKFRILSDAFSAGNLFSNVLARSPQLDQIVEGCLHSESSALDRFRLNYVKSDGSNTAITTRKHDRVGCGNIPTHVLPIKPNDNMYFPILRNGNFSLKALKNRNQYNVCIP